MQIISSGVVTASDALPLHHHYGNWGDYAPNLYYSLSSLGGVDETADDYVYTRRMAYWQPFVLPKNVTAPLLKIRMYQSSLSAADVMLVGIYSSISFAPVTLLEQVTIAHADIVQASPAVLSAQFAGSYQADVTYWLGQLVTLSDNLQSVGVRRNVRGTFSRIGCAASITSTLDVGRYAQAQAGDTLPNPVSGALTTSSTLAQWKVLL